MTSEMCARGAHLCSGRAAHVVNSSAVMRSSGRLGIYFWKWPVVIVARVDSDFWGEASNCEPFGGRCVVTVTPRSEAGTFDWHPNCDGCETDFRRRRKDG